MRKVLLVCVGGAFGSGARFLVGTWAASTFGPDLPRGTIIVNLAGSYLIALVLGVADRTTAISPDARLFLTTGIMGGFTTYSSFNHETLRFFQGGAFGYAGLYLALTVLGCLATGALGLASARLPFPIR